MNALRDLLSEYDQLGDVRFSSSHDYTLRQRMLESWAAKAREIIAELVQASSESADGGGEGDLPVAQKRTGS